MLQSSHRIFQAAVCSKTVLSSAGLCRKTDLHPVWIMFTNVVKEPTITYMLKWETLVSQWWESLPSRVCSLTEGPLGTVCSHRWQKLQLWHIGQTPSSIDGCVGASHGLYSPPPGGRIFLTQNPDWLKNCQSKVTSIFCCLFIHV